MDNRTAVNIDGALITYQDDEVVFSSHSASTDIFFWCQEHEIDADILWGGFGGSIRSVWGLKDSGQRLMFTLKWS